MRTALLTIEAMSFGVIAGSIGSSARYRRARALSMFTTERSRCDHCGTTVEWRDLVPVLSWLVLGGCCRRCHRPISDTYLHAELAAGAACGAVMAAVVGSVPALASVVIVTGGAWALARGRRAPSVPGSPAVASGATQRPEQHRARHHHQHRPHGEPGAEREPVRPGPPSPDAHDPHTTR